MIRYNFATLVAKALGNHKTWPEQFPDAAPKPAYDAVIVGAGGHGLGPCQLHNASYDFNDHLLPIGASYWVKLVEMSLPKT